MKRITHLLLAAFIGSAAIGVDEARSNDLKLEAAAVPLPSFQLTDHTGSRFDQSEMQEQWSLLFLGYTFCPDICPMTLSELTGLIETFEDRYPTMPLPQIVFLAVDPDRDQEMLPDYVTAFHEKTVGITGDRAEIDRIVTAMQGFYKLEAADQDGDYTVQHSASINVVDPKGRIVAKFNPPLDPDTGADALLTIMRSGNWS